MSISLFGIALLIFSVVLFFKNINRGIAKVFSAFFILRVLIGIFLDRGYIFAFGSLVLEYDTFVSLLLFIIAIICALKGKIDRTVFKSGLILIFACLFGLAVNLLFSYKQPVIVNLADWEKYIRGKNVMVSAGVSFGSLVWIFTLFRYVLAISVLKYFFDSSFKHSFIRSVSIVGTVVIAYGFVEFFLVNYLNANMDSLILNIFFGKNTYASLSSRGDVFGLKGFRIEPSYFAMSLFFLCLISLGTFKYNKYRLKKLNIVGSLFLLVLSMSFSSVVYIGLVTFYLFFYWVSIKSKKALIFPIAAIIVLALVFISKSSVVAYYFERIEWAMQTVKNIIIKNTAGTYNWSSEAVRFTSIINNLHIFVSRPLFGIGIGATDAHSTIASAFANFGLVGIVAYCSFIRKLSYRNGLIIFILVLSQFIIGSFGYLFDFIFPTIIIVTARSKQQVSVGVVSVKPKAENNVRLGVSC